MSTKVRQAMLEERIDQFEEAWLQGGRPAIDEFLPVEPADRLAVLNELVHADREAPGSFAFRLHRVHDPVQRGLAGWLDC